MEHILSPVTSSQYCRTADRKVIGMQRYYLGISLGSVNYTAGSQNLTSLASQSNETTNECKNTWWLRIKSAKKTDFLALIPHIHVHTLKLISWEWCMLNYEITINLVCFWKIKLFLMAANWVFQNPLIHSQNSGRPNFVNGSFSTQFDSQSILSSPWLPTGSLYPQST